MRCGERLLPASDSPAATDTPEAAALVACATARAASAAAIAPALANALCSELRALLGLAELLPAGDRWLLQARGEAVCHVLSHEPQGV